MADLMDASRQHSRAARREFVDGSPPPEAQQGPPDPNEGSLIESPASEPDGDHLSDGDPASDSDAATDSDEVTDRDEVKDRGGVR